MQEATRAIDFFSELFGIAYPPAKMDILAIPEFAFGAMENWGLITAKTALMLLDDMQGFSSQKIFISSTMMHEVAHQWFGNLVTMDWWNELWLNEGFATWASHYATSLCHPEWNSWERFVSGSMESALSRDAMRSSHPIHTEVPDARTVHEIFDIISYQKSCAVIDMLANHMGPSKFLAGVSSYLQQNLYKNATAEDLWRALSEVSGEDVIANIKPWIRAVGHPILIVDERPEGLVLRQTRFLAADDTNADDDGTLWWIPLGFRGILGGEAAGTPLALTEKQQTIPISHQHSSYLFNASGTGFYRVQYTTSHFQALGVAQANLKPIEKLTVMGSASSLAFLGQGSTVSLLSFLTAFENESDPLVWIRMMRNFARVRKRFDEDSEISGAIKRLILKIISGLVAKVGWERKSGDSDMQCELRGEVLEEAFYCGSQDVIAAALQHYVSHKNDEKRRAVDPEVHYLVWGAAAVSASREVAPYLIRKWRESTLAQEKLRYLVGLSVITDQQVILDVTLPFCYGTEPEGCVLQPTNMRPLVSCLASNESSRGLQWTYIKSNWNATVGKMGSSQQVQRVIAAALSGFTEESMANDIDHFFADKDVTGFALTLQTAKERIMGLSRYVQRERAPLADWLK